jgi:4-amino-4-deoxy-L-arabinose transferase-like glycosyltransferase
MALAAVNPNLWILGQHVSTDMLFAALAAGALLAGLCYLEEPGWPAALAGGALLGLAAFTRSNAVFLVPPLLAAWWLSPGQRWSKRRLAHLAAATGLALLVLVPHWGLRQAVFGDPFHDENWKNLAWKLHGYPDWSYLDRVPYSGGLAVVRDDPSAVVRGGVSELRRFFFGGGAPQLFGTWAHVLLLAAGAVVAVRRRPLAAWWLLGAGGLFLVALAFVFFTWGRLLLFLIPPAYALAFAPWGMLAERWRRPLDVLGAALLLLLAVKTFGFRLPDFVSRHPYREIAVLRRLDAALPPGAALAGSSPFLGRYLRHPYVDLPDAFGPEIAQPDRWFIRVEPLVRRAGVEYLVVGITDLRDRPASLLQTIDPAPWLHLVDERDGIAVWQVR